METQTAKVDSVREEHFFMRYVLMITTVAALGGLLFGYDWVVIGGARAFYESYFRLTSERLIGVASAVSPTYIAEVSPAPWRGRMVAVNQLGIGLGVLLAQVVNYLIAQKV